MDRVDEPTLFKTLREALPIDNLLEWLLERYPDLSDLALLTIYHTLIEHRHWQVTQADTPRSLDLHTVRVTHYSHGLAESSQT